MKVFGLSGWSGSGKTTLVVRLIPELLSRGYSVSTVKHAHHAFEIDRDGTDSFRHRSAGAGEVAAQEKAEAGAFWVPPEAATMPADLHAWDLV